MKIVLLTLLSITAANAATIEQILAEVGKNQDADVAARSQFVYHQNLLVRMKRANGKLAREETRDYTVTPRPEGIKRELVQFTGKIGQGKNTVTYDKPEFRYKNIDIDGELVQNFADDFGVDKKTKDGVSHDLFPLRTEAQKNYTFKLVGKERWHDHDAYRIEWEPVGKRDLENEHCWEGEALIDQAESQPLEVTTHWACKIPVLVKTMLGTNVHQIGFKVTYAKFDDGVWFPVTYGGEFEFRAVFMYARKVGIGLVNSDFHRTQVESAIKYDGQ